MSFNNARESRRFQNEQKKMTAEYKAAGMTEEQIREMQEFDKAAFNRNRCELEWRGKLNMDFIETDYSLNSDKEIPDRLLGDMNTDVLEIESDRKETWLESIHLTNDEMWQMIVSMSERNIEIIYLYASVGYNQTEIGKILGINQRTISYQINKLKDAFVKFI